MADKKLTLTFDHGPTPGVTERVLDVLRERDLHATFFPTGSHLAEPGVRALAERVLAEGHWLGNHTMTHGAPLGKRNDPAVEVGEIALAQEALGSLSHPDKLFRPNGSGQVGPHLLAQPPSTSSSSAATPSSYGISTSATPTSRRDGPTARSPGSASATGTCSWPTTCPPAR